MAFDLTPGSMAAIIVEIWDLCKTDITLVINNGMLQTNWNPKRAKPETGLHKWTTQLKSAQFDDRLQQHQVLLVSKNSLPCI